MKDRSQASPQLLPVGTQVVTRVPLRDAQGREVRPVGAVGVILRAPADLSHRYRVRFADGDHAQLRRFELEVLSHHQSGVLGQAVEEDLFSFVMYRCVVGSKAFGLADESSDVDVRGIYLPPARLHWSMTGVPGLIEQHGSDECYWELEHFLVLALKGNPNILECLYTPLIEHRSELAEQLLEMRGAFLSRFLHKTYNGYVLSQFKKLQRNLEGGGGIKWKHAMHLIRLLLSGLEVLRRGVLALDVGEHRERLLGVKRGELAWEEVEAWRQSLQQAFDAALRGSPLPERPDHERVNAFLLKARRHMVER